MATTAAKTSPRTAKPAAKRTTTRAKTAASTPRASTQTRAARPSPALAERAVLIPVGAALIAREQVASSVGDVISIYSSPTKAKTQLRKFERRGATARNRLEREVRKTRTRFERELRQRRSDSSELASRVQERVLNLV
jgi:hypothetical protein